MRTFQDLLKDEYDAELFDYYATSQLVLASLDGTVKPIGPPAIYTSVDPSPDDKYIMLSSIHRPYSYIVPCGRFPKKVELWTVDGKFIRELCDLPLAEDIPITMSSVRKGKRSINWRPDKPSILYWYVEHHSKHNLLKFALVFFSVFLEMNSFCNIILHLNISLQSDNRII